jgi:hypothetical protein
MRWRNMGHEKEGEPGMGSMRVLMTLGVYEDAVYQYTKAQSTSLLKKDCPNNLQSITWTEK